MSTQSTPKKNIVTTEPNSHEIKTSRTFDAPLELVYRAHTDPELVIRWWGGPYPSKLDRFSPETGGSWRFESHDDEGNTWAFHGVFHEVTPNRIVQTFEFEGMPGHVSLDSMTFTEENGKTTLTGSSVFQSIEDRDGMIASGMETGWSASMDLLEELLRTR